MADKPITKSNSNPNKLVPLGVDDAGSIKKTPNVEGNTVEVSHTVRPSRDGSRFQLTWVLDFTGVTREQELELMSRVVTIDLQREWRAAADRMDASWDGRTISVADHLNASRKGADPAKRAQGAMAKLSPEERKALMALFNADGTMKE